MRAATAPFWHARPWQPWSTAQRPPRGAWLALVDDGAPVPEPLQEAVAEVLRALRTAPNKADAEAVARALRIRRSVDWDLRTEQAGLLYAALRDAGYTHEECKELVSQLVPEVDEDAAAAAYRRLLK